MDQDATAPPAAEPRDEAGRYRVGNPGNPRGRPRRSLEEAAFAAVFAMARATGAKVTVSVDLARPTDLPRAA